MMNTWQHNVYKTLIILGVMASHPLMAADNVPVSDFSQQQLTDWKPQVFSGKTAYEFEQQGKETVLTATSQASASGLVRRIRVDLQETPFLNWSWQIQNQLPGLNEQTKAGDDYAARVYVVVDGGLLKWNSKAVNYVWASNTSRGQSWGNAFLPDNAKMLAVRGTQDKPMGIVKEKRNVAADFKQLFGTEVRYIDAVAIMTDTDNSKGEAQAAYGDIFFSSK